MKRNRWLHAFFAATMVFVIVLAAVTWSPSTHSWVAYLIVGALTAAYAAFGWRGFEDARVAAVFVPLMIVATFGLVAVSPSTAFVQCIVYPVLWTQIERTRTAVVACVLVGVAASFGFIVSLGATPDTYAQIAIIEGASVVGACALGVWISNIHALSDSRQQLLDELQATQESLAAANRAAGVSSERERMARELHDTIAQNLAGIVMLSQRSRRDLAAGRLDDDRLALIEDSAKDALEESRTLVAAGAAGLAAGGLGAALHRLGERFGRETGIVVTVEACGDDMDRDAQVVLLRVAQEALANVRAHADATTVQVTLEQRPQTPDAHRSQAWDEQRPQTHDGHRPQARDADRPGGTGLRIADDGHGFDTRAPAPGFGLRGLRERLALAGGTFDVSSTPGGGTVVTASVGPVAAERRLVEVTR
ncbi:sensor histidine kinase [Curtobacterium sp. Leaf261]|uniref:sensor histidine kinase n=1 Tax=Curtobacterium sp. Leaf261 TaxID=1736311 RepID=UPI000700747E|nr:sensor histidine kinase [Curtobacterium sp. Leaf261]KQO65184.1 hypothetical protein ASF23_03475 [Curtobacterium sp. Leaf261]